MQVLGHRTARGGAFGGVVAEHAGEFGVRVGPSVQVRHLCDGYPGEQALQNGVAPVVGVEVAGGVGADGGGQEPGVVGAQGVLDERDGFGAGHQMGQGVQDGAAFGGGALGVDPGQGVGVGAGRVQDQDADGVGVFGAAAAAGLGEAQLPHGDGAVGAGVGGGFVEGLVEPGAGGFAEAFGDVAVQVVQRGSGEGGALEVRRGGCLVGMGVGHGVLPCESATA